MNRIKVKTLITIIALFFLFSYIRMVDFAAVKHHLGIIGWNAICIILVSAVAYYLGAVAWLLCFDGIKRRPSLRHIFDIRLISESLALTNPAGVLSGDALKVYLLKNKQEEKHIVSSVIISRILTIVSFFAIITMTLMIFGQVLFDLYSGFTTSVVSIILLFIILIISYMSVSQKLLLYRGISYLGSISNIGFISRLAEKSKAINAVMANYFKNNMRNLSIAFFLLVLHWFFGAVEFYVMFSSIGHQISLADSMLLEFGTAFFRSVFAFIPFQIGIEEYSTKLLMAKINITEDAVWLSLTILRRTRQLFWIVMAAIIYFFVYRSAGKSQY